MSGPPPLKDAGSLVRIPREAWQDVTSLASIEMIMVRNSIMGEFECCYQIWLISRVSLHLNQPEAWDQPGANWGLTDQCIK